MQLLLVLALAAASVSGMVTAEHYPLPGCIVSVRSRSGVNRYAVSNAEGRYRIEGLEPGAYKVQVELAGFKAVERDTVVVEGDNEQPDDELQLAPVTSIITITTCPMTVKPCTEAMPASPSELPSCWDYEFDTLLLEAVERGDSSALDLVRRRHDTATTDHQKRRLAAALLRHVRKD